MSERAYFPRRELAESIAKQLLSPSLLGGAAPGLFLAAPRRKGKSTFLRRDLSPALEQEGTLVLYVDLWANLDTSPAELIAGVIARALAKHQSTLAKLANASGISKVKIQNVEFTIDRIGKTAGATLSDALQELHSLARKPIVFIIDEAQHVVTADKNMTVMAALKAARDALNSTGDNLYLVMSGSDRDKLLRLVHGTGAPFFGATIHTLPDLGKDYVAYAAGAVVRVHPGLEIDNARLASIFDRYEHRPEFFEQDIGAAISPLAGSPEGFIERLERLATERELVRDAVYAATFDDLSSLQKAIVAELAVPRAGAPRLFTKEALARYSQATKKKIQAGQARSAVEQLRDRDPPMIWKSDRGDYAFEDTEFLRWFQTTFRVSP